MDDNQQVRVPELLELRATCYRTRYYIENGSILPIPGARVEEYNPFDYYEKEKDRVVNESLHIQFANWDFSDSKGIEEFCNTWGILGIGARRDLHAPWYTMPLEGKEKYHIKKPPLPAGVHSRAIEPWENAEPESEFLKEYAFYKWALLVNITLREGYREDYRKLLSYIMGDKVPKNDVLDDDHVKDLLISHCLNLVNAHLDYVRPHVLFVTGGEGGEFDNLLQWRFPSLLDALYMMMVLDFHKERYIRICKSNTCKKIFMTDRKDKIYCSRDCARYQTNRDYRERQTALNMYAEGNRINVIAAELGKDPDLISKWVEQSSD